MKQEIKIEMLENHIKQLNQQLKDWQDLSLKKHEIIESYKSILSTYKMTNTTEMSDNTLTNEHRASNRANRNA